MTSIDDHMVNIYVFVSDYMDQHPGTTQWRTSPNAHPAFTDEEVITLALLQGCFGCATLKKTYLLVASSAHLRSAFPHLCSYTQFVARLHKLSALVGRLIQAALLADGIRIYVVDGKPIPVCKPIRHGRVKLLREDGAYFGKGSTGWFFGFKLHAFVHAVTGQVVSAILTAANFNERDAAMALADSVYSGGIVLADLGYRSKDDELDNWLMDQCSLTLVTPAEAKATGNLRYKALVSSVRERVETTFSALYDRFVDRILSRSWEGLWSTIKLKMLHFNLCQAGVISA